MTTPVNPDLAIEIGKAQATARAAQEALEKVEKHLSERIDRLETRVDKGFDRVDKGFEGLEDKFETGISEIKTLLKTHHEKITTIEIKSSHEDGVTKNKNESRSTRIAVYAVVIALLSALSNIIGPIIAKYL